METTLRVGACSMAPATAWRTLAQIAAASCSTQPGCGVAMGTGAWARPTTAPLRSTTRHLVELVPWSMLKRTSLDMSLPLQFQSRRDYAFAGQAEMIEQKLRCAGWREALDAEHPHGHGRMADDDFGDRRAKAAFNHGFLNGDDRAGLTRSGDNGRFVERLDRGDVQHPRRNPVMFKRLRRRERARDHRAGGGDGQIAALAQDGDLAK